MESGVCKWWDSPPCPGIFIQAQGDLFCTNLGLFDYDCAFFTDFDAAFASKTFFGIDGHGFTVLHLEYFNRTNIHALFTTGALLFIDDRIKSHYQTLLSMNYNKIVL
jgi:hypothetical protein